MSNLSIRHDFEWGFNDGKNVGCGNLFVKI